MVERVAGQPDDMGGIHHRDRVWKLFGGGGLEPGETRPSRRPPRPRAT
jgi:hypothetical protein